MSPADRRRKVVAGLDQGRFDGLIVTSETNVGYLTGFSGDSSALVLTSDQAVIVSDARYEVQLAEECPELRRVIRPIGQPLAVGIGKVVLSLGLDRVGFEADAVSVADHKVLRKAARGVNLVSTSGRVERLRMIKDAGEVAAIREAIAIAERSFRALLADLRPEATEKALADRLDGLLRDHGATGASFPPIVATGPRSALPHARPSGSARLGDSGLVLIDWGARVDGYVSDLTRVVATGKVHPDFKAAHAVVLEAQGRAIAAIRPGVEARSIDAEARSVIEGAGLGRRFNHSVGHGIGREVHEAPVLRHLTETKLVPGMVVTVEPGVYVPEWGGVRIEDDVLVTPDGPEVLSGLPRSAEWAVP